MDQDSNEDKEIKSAEIIIRDVGLGDSIYVKVTKKNGQEATYLIDTGYLKNVDQLKEIGIKKIDTLILTHKHLDHISAATYIIEHYKDYGLKDIFFTCRDSFFASKTNIALSEQLNEIYERRHSDINAFDINDNDAVDARLDFKVLYPKTESQYHQSNMNRNSIVLLLQVGSYNVLFTGDATQKEEELILETLHKTGTNSVHVLKIPHHGSSTSTSSDFLRELQDLQYAVVSASALGTKNLPSKEFEDRWCNFSETHSCEMFYTEDGSIRQNIRLTVDSEAGCEIECGCQQKSF